ncbi:hypothetical protein G6O67_003314 [Ophiocordyceps sinensis]|uniref:Uncharacterized protein n=1 Tax=Ophiocordyceps sinensis TaxID=72228 RepID=A0A8H4PWI7_9HYPO|nr:hypothetical protein G6O67_003314 [Ophiocordyceps sinensis]
MIENTVRVEQSKQAREVGDALQVRQSGVSHELMPRSILTLKHGIVNEFTTFLPNLTPTPTAGQAKPPSTVPPAIASSSSSPASSFSSPAPTSSSPAPTANRELVALPTTPTALREKGEMPTPKADPQNAVGALSHGNMSRGEAIGIAAGVFSAFAAMVLAGVLLYKYRKRKKRNLNSNLNSVHSDLSSVHSNSKPDQ